MIRLPKQVCDTLGIDVPIAQAPIDPGARRTDRPLAVNLVLDFPIDDVLDACLAEEASTVSTFWGDPAKIAARVKDTRLIHTAGSVAEARQAAESGVDFVVAQGWEAGGHVRG